MSSWVHEAYKTNIHAMRSFRCLWPRIGNTFRIAKHTWNDVLEAGTRVALDGVFSLYSEVSFPRNNEFVRNVLTPHGVPQAFKAASQVSKAQSAITVNIDQIQWFHNSKTLIDVRTMFDASAPDSILITHEGRRFQFAPPGPSSITLQKSGSSSHIVEKVTLANYIAVI